MAYPHKRRTAKERWPETGVLPLSRRCNVIYNASRIWGGFWWRVHLLRMRDDIVCRCCVRSSPVFYTTSSWLHLPGCVSKESNSMLCSLKFSRLKSREFYGTTWLPTVRNQGRNHVFKLGVHFLGLGYYYPSTEKLDRCSRLHNHTLFIKKLCKKWGVRPNFGEVRTSRPPQWLRPCMQFTYFYHILFVKFEIGPQLRVLRSLYTKMLTG